MPNAFNASGKILLALLSGLLLGAAIHAYAADIHWLQSYVVGGVFHVVGALFLNALKMLVVPLVAASLLCGIGGMQDVNVLGRIGMKTMGLYLLTMGIAVTLGLLAAIIFAPGQGYPHTPTSAVGFKPKTPPPFSELLINLVPTNPVKAFADGDMLQIIIFVVLFGVTLLLVGDKGRPLLQLADSLNETMMRLVGLVLRCAPLGVFCLIAKAFAEQGIGLLGPMLGYAAVLASVLLLQGFGVLTALVAVWGKINPWLFLEKIRSAQLFAFSTASSNATIPMTLQVTEQRLGIDNRIAAFTIPLGATVNMDGTAIMHGVATVFIANVYHIGLGLGQYLTIAGMAVLASVGTAGVPGAALVTLTMVLQQVGLPVEGIALIVGVNRLLDMLGTAVNVTDDIAVACIVARSEGGIDWAVLEGRETDVPGNDA